MIVVLVVVRVSYAVLFTAGNVAVERLWGGVSSRTVVMFLYIVTLIVAVVPGVLVAVVVSLAASLSLTAGLLVLAVANLLVGALVLFLCRNMLEIAELNQT